MEGEKECKMMNGELKCRVFQNSKSGKKNKKRSGIAPLRLLTLAPFRTWGIQQELVVPLGRKCKAKISGFKQAK